MRYGTGTAAIYADKIFTGGTACNNYVFGDPAVGANKWCWYSAIIGNAAPTPTPVPAPSPNGPIVLNASTSVRPGDVFSLQGENFGTAATVWLDGATTRQLEVVNRVGTGWLAVQMPADASGALSVRVINGSLTGAQVKLNAAIPHHLDALQLAPSGAFRVFGRNLMLPNATPVVTVNSLPAKVDVGLSDAYMLVVTAPAGLTAGAATVVVDNGNGSGPATLDRPISVATGGSGDPFALNVGWAAAFSAYSGRSIAAASDARLANRVACNGVQDDAPALQAAVDLAVASGGAVVKVPAGNCRLRGNVNLKSKVVIEGAGKDATVLQYESNYPISASRIDLAGLRNLTLSSTGGAQEGMLLKDSTRVFLQNVKVNLGTSHQMFLSGNTNAVIAGCDFIQLGSLDQNGPYLTNGSGGLVFSGNVTRWVNGASAFGGTHDSYFANNRFIRDASQQNAAGTVHSFTIDFAYRIAVAGNSFEVANGPITNKTRNDGETILTEGGGAARTENLGSVASATANTVSDPSNTIVVDPFGSGSIPENYGIAIVAGKGAGQTRHVVGYAGGRMTVDQDWSIVPDTTSRYATFVWGLEKSIIRNNALAQNPRGIWLYHTAVREVDVVSNKITDGGGIYLRSYQNLAAKMFMPIYNVRIAGNTVSNNTGNWMSYIDATFVNADAKAFGIANLGIEIRDNKINANAVNLNSAYEEYANMEGYINMMRVENYDIYEAMTTPRLLGSVFQRNTCARCDVGFRIGTGAGGTTLVGNSLVSSKELLDDWATTKDGSKSIGTVIR